MVVLTGPPALRSKDREIVDKFINTPGIHVVAGSTTADIVSRELGKDVKLVNIGLSFGSQPEYKIEGIDLVTEGAIMLNQVYNILDEDRSELDDSSLVERFCAMMLEADVFTFIVGSAVNAAHTSWHFKQTGIRPRLTAVQLISKKLKELGKLVIEIKY